MVIFLYGDDTYRSRAHLKRIIERFQKERDPSGYNTILLDGEKDEGGKIIEELMALPFLADRRLVAVSHLLSGDQTDLWKILLQKITDQTIPKETTLLVWEEDTPKKAGAKKLFELLKKEQFAQEFEILKGSELVGWIEDESKQHHISLSRSLADVIAKRTKGDLWYINSLLSQLAGYTGGATITLADIDMFLPSEESDTIFALVDAVTGGQKNTAYKLLQSEYRQGKEPAYIAAMLSRQYRLLLEMADIFEREGMQSADTLAKRLGIHPFVAKKTLQSMREYTRESLQKIHHAFVSLDESLKSGGNTEAELDLLIAKLSEK